MRHLAYSFVNVPALQGVVERLSRRAAYSLLICLSLAVPFDASRNIDLQGLLLIIAGCFAIGSLLLSPKGYLKRMVWWQWVLLSTYVLSSLISVIVNPHISYDLLGGPYIRLGSLGLVSCVACALLVNQLPRKALIVYLYLLTLIISLLAVPYSLIVFHSLHRIGGIFAQADIMACVAAVGFLLGLAIWKFNPRRIRLLIISQFFLIGILLLTETRAVIGLTLALGIVWLFQNLQNHRFKILLLAILASVMMVVGSHHFLRGRVTDLNYAADSFSYRLDLQHAGLHASVKRPMAGYGPGNLADALDCRQLRAASLQGSCQKGYFFNSSHNIYLDRVLGIGYIGGLSFLALVIAAIYRSCRRRDSLVMYPIVLISSYYLTNVTNISLELLLWILLFHVLIPTSACATLDKA